MCVLFFVHTFLFVESRPFPFQESLSGGIQDTLHVLPDSLSFNNRNVEEENLDSSRSVRRNRRGVERRREIDTVLQVADTTLRIALDSSGNLVASDTLSADSTPKVKKAFLEDVLNSKNKDSLIYDIKSGRVYIYNEGEVLYQDKTLNADYIDMDMTNDLISAKGSMDTLNNQYVKPVFKEGETVYNMDSIVYNMKSEKAKIYGIQFKEGEGILRGKDIKKMDDEIYNIHEGIYTTCDAEHPHFYLAMTKAQYVQGKRTKKVIIGPSYLVLEDVPLPIGIPFGFFPMVSDKNSGFIIPEIGEENIKGFFLRDGGYYFVFNDYMDLAVQGGIYTMGSWETSLTSSYKKRYKFNGNFSFDYSKDIIGDKSSTDYQNMNNYRLSWSHSQDPKFRPNSTFSASVNFSSSNYNKYDAESISDYTSAQTNSSISYSKTWAGTPFSLSANFQHSQNNRDSSVMLSLPNFVFNVSRIYPFQRKEMVGKQRWYEKISMSYTNTFNNSVTTKQDLLFKKDMFKNMKYGMKHEIPINSSFNLLRYLNLSPTFNYTERWYFSKIDKVWDPEYSNDSGYDAWFLPGVRS